MIKNLFLIFLVFDTFLPSQLVILEAGFQVELVVAILKCVLELVIAIRMLGFQRLCLSFFAEFACSCLSSLF